MKRNPLNFLLPALLAIGLAGCGDDGDSGLQNKDPGSNDPHVVVAIGDSLTYGNTPSYPEILASQIDKTVINAGENGTLAADNIDRARTLIDQHHPAFMLILYGINDVIHSSGIDAIVAALDQMVAICEDNHVVPVLATYPEPILDYTLFAPRTLLLNQRIRNLAASHDIHCVDLEREFDANRELYEDDGLHPNDQGTKIIALAFADLF